MVPSGQRVSCVLKQNIPFDGDTARFDAHLDAWSGTTHRRWRHNHNVLMLIIMVMTVPIIMAMIVLIMTVMVMTVMTLGVLVIFVVLMVFTLFVMLLMMTAMPVRTGRGDQWAAQ